jgi:antitoxin MazE
METFVKKWGNSLALRIPAPLAAEIGLYNGSPVELALVDGRLVVSPRYQRKYDLERLLAQVTEKNLHGEIDVGPAK